jgi:radical SAM superfamily enzyme YgiQ (UPF0313 family)
MTDRVLLVNPNRMRPPVAPLGLEYVAADIERNGYEPIICDLTFAQDWAPELDAAINGQSPLAVGVTVRNVDDCFFASRDFVLDTTTEMIRRMRTLTDAPIVLGGVGFSVMPKEVLAYTGADYGIVGDGEAAFAALLDRLTSGANLSDLPGLVYRPDGTNVVANPPANKKISDLPAPPRRYIDNARYFAEGGQAGVETKRGCGGACVYCVDPLAKGTRSRPRSPQAVAAEFKDLLEQGIDVFHLCDCEVNMPYDHALAIANALIDAGLGESIRWYAYAAPHLFDDSLAKAMARAGCVGINFGADHSDPDILQRLGRPYGPDDIRKAVSACKNEGIAVMLDMLFGSPGETKETLTAAVDFLKQTAPDCIGLSCGVRLYPRTKLAEHILAQGPIENNPRLHGAVKDNPNFFKPVYYVEENLGASIHSFVSTLVGDDKRFFHTDPDQVDGNYNYNDNSVLTNAIRNGARGAYWDILRRLAA